MHTVVRTVAPVGAAIILLGALTGAGSPGCSSQASEPDRSAAAVTGDGPGEVMPTADGPDIWTVVTGTGTIHIRYQVKAPAGSRWARDFCDTGTDRWQYADIGTPPGGLVVTVTATGSGPLGCEVSVNPGGPKVTGRGTGSVSCRLVTRG